MKYLRHWWRWLLVVYWSLWFRVAAAVYQYVFLGVPVRRWRRRLGLGMLVMWGPCNTYNGYPWLWVKYDTTLRPWMAKREMAAQVRWAHAYQRARWGC